MNGAYPVKTDTHYLQSKRHAMPTPPNRPVMTRNRHHVPWKDDYISVSTAPPRLFRAMVAGALAVGGRAILSSVNATVYCRA